MFVLFFCFEASPRKSSIELITCSLLILIISRVLALGAVKQKTTTFKYVIFSNARTNKQKHLNMCIAVGVIKERKVLEAK